MQRWLAGELRERGEEEGTAEAVICRETEILQ